MADEAMRIPEPAHGAVATWLATLPLANSEICFEAIATVLREHNGSSGLSPVLRFELAELLRPTVLMLVQRSESRIIDSALPYSPDLEHFAESQFWLHKELASAYLRASHEATSAAPKTFGSDWPLWPVFRAFQHLGGQLLSTAHRYTNSDPGFWARLYGLYRLAEERNLLAGRVADYDEPEPARTPMGQFLRCLLFSLVNTKTLRQRDMAVVFALLGTLVEDAKWRRHRVPDENVPVFAIDLGEKRPPSRNAPGSPDESAGHYFLSTVSVVKALLKAAKGQDGSETRPGLDSSVLLRVARSLGARDKRKSSRRPDDESCRCVTGLNRLIGLLSLSLPNPFASDLPAPELRGAPVGGSAKDDELELIQKDAWGTAGYSFEGRLVRNPAVLNELFQTDPSADAGTASRSPIWTGEAAGSLSSSLNVARSAGARHGKIISSGPRGYGIIWPSAPVAWLRVGDLIGVWASDDSLFIGTIRWLDCGPRGPGFGVELLAPSARVVDLFDNAGRRLGQALLLPSDPVLRPLPELLFSPTGLQPGSVVSIGLDGKIQRYWVKVLLEQTPAYGRFSLAEAWTVWNGSIPSGSGETL